MRVALYARVSTNKQDELNQLPILEQYAQSRGYKVYRIYTDRASGCNPDRPAWRDLMADGFKCRFDLVIAVRLDRIMRSVIHLNEVVQDLGKYNISIELVDIGRLDTKSANGVMMVNILASIAQWERQILSERTRAVLEEKRKQGIKGGRPMKSIDIDTAARLRLSGHTLKQASAKMGCTVSDLNNRRVLILARMNEILGEEERNKGAKE